MAEVFKKAISEAPDRGASLLPFLGVQYEENDYLLLQCYKKGEFKQNFNI